MPPRKGNEWQMVFSNPLGDEAFHVVRFRGEEALSELFRFEVELLAPNATAIPFERLVGQDVSLHLRLTIVGAERRFSGILESFTECERVESFTRYRAVIVPPLWLLTQVRRCRVFQDQTIPQILKAVFQHLKLDCLKVEYQLSHAYVARTMCVQYRESDFAFASRLMEEEGIHYRHRHAADGCVLVVADDPLPRAKMSGLEKVPFDYVEGGERDDLRVWRWEKTQRLTPAKFGIRDGHFEMPGTHIGSESAAPEKIMAGKVSHQLRGGFNSRLEILDGNPGFAHRFDLVGPNGEERANAMSQVFEEAKHAARLGIEQETVRGLSIEGRGNCAPFLPGHVFELLRHHHADGKYYLSRVEHDAAQSGPHSDDTAESRYENRFTCLPADLPFRPSESTPKPIIPGTQTASVVGPAGKELFLDKYGRVKVHFQWDGRDKKDTASSCWLRVAQLWAGKRWGAFFWPRVGQEVVVAFENGDPDRPIVVGSVYNAVNMPPFELPANDLVSGIKSCSVGPDADPLKHFNGVLFFDQIGQERAEFHSERQQTTQSETGQCIRAGEKFVQVVGGFPKLGSGSGGGGEHGSDDHGKKPDDHGKKPDDHGGDHGGEHGPSPTLVDALKPGWASHLTFTFGDHGIHVLGLAGEYVVGSETNIVINPVGFAAQFGPNPFVGGLTGAIGGIMGEVGLCVGAGTELHYGPGIEIHRGAHIHGGGNKAAPVSVAAGCGIILGGAIMAANVLAASEWKNADAQLCGVLANIVRGTVLAMMVGFESFFAWEHAAEHESHSAKEDVDEGGHDVEDIAKLVPDVTSESVRKMVKTAMRDVVPDILTKATKKATKSAQSLVLAMTNNLLGVGNDRVEHVYEGSFAIAANTIGLRARDLEGNGGFMELSAAKLDLFSTARTSVSAKVIVMRPEEHFSIWSGDNTVVVDPEGVFSSTHLGLLATDLEMRGSSARLRLRMGSMPLPLGELSMNEDGLKLKAGMWEMTMDQNGIFLKVATNKIALTPDGITMKGLKIDWTADLLMTLKAALMQENVEGPVSRAAAIDKM